MVTAVVWIALVMAAHAAPPASPRADDPDEAVRAALARGGYPWYDARPGVDSFEPVLSEQSSFTEWLERWFGSGGRGGRTWSRSAWLGELFAIGLAVLGVAVLLVLLAELWRRYRPVATAEPAAPAAAGRAAGRIEGLPAGVRPETEDPWAEALECRARGDYARAVVCLFAHQLLTLARLRLLRLAPGRTGRQLVRTIDDAGLRGCVDPVLGLFELVYYGHRAPSAQAFEAVWSRAEDFERRVAGGQA